MIAHRATQAVSLGLSQVKGARELSEGERALVGQLEALSIDASAALKQYLDAHP